MTKYNWLILLVFSALLLCSCKRDDLTDTQYVGYYHPVERISLDFKAGERVTARINSTDFVGWFSDELYGHYEYSNLVLTLSWDRASLGNWVYKDCPPNPDSILISPSLDTLILYEGETSYVLKRETVEKADSIRRNIFVFLSKNAIIVILIILALILAFVILFFKWLRETGPK